jgi:hypothetical protein
MAGAPSRRAPAISCGDSSQTHGRDALRAMYSPRNASGSTPPTSDDAIRCRNGRPSRRGGSGGTRCGCSRRRISRTCPGWRSRRRAGVCRRRTRWSSTSSRLPVRRARVDDQELPTLPRQVVAHRQPGLTAPTTTLSNRPRSPRPSPPSPTADRPQTRPQPTPHHDHVRHRQTEQQAAGAAVPHQLRTEAGPPQRTGHCSRDGDIELPVSEPRPATALAWGRHSTGSSRAGRSTSSPTSTTTDPAARPDSTQRHSGYRAPDLALVVGEATYRPVPSVGAAGTCFTRRRSCAPYCTQVWSRSSAVRSARTLEEVDMPARVPPVPVE